MTNRVTSFSGRICGWFGHKFSDLELLMFEIERVAIAGPRPEIRCRRCGQWFTAPKK